mmetsp:Transcript_37720/g.40929  ORF Transcript_37720/g.40929 Transcript_37720/m.40929 type:complete len:96 (-) Transcript_37720:212-499(-)
MKDCDDFGLAFHASGLLMGSIDLIQVCNEFILLTLSPSGEREIFCGRFHQKIQMTKTLPYVDGFEPPTSKDKKKRVVPTRGVKYSIRCFRTHQYR